MDCASRGVAGSHDGFIGRTMVLSQKLNPPQSPDSVPHVLLGKLTCKGLIMTEQLEIIDLGDAMTETQCALTQGSWVDAFYGPGHIRC
jgi:hypothetical protein